MPGGYGGGVIPVPFPNTEVKPPGADGTAPLRRGRVGSRRAFFLYVESLVLSIQQKIGYNKPRNMR